MNQQTLRSQIEQTANKYVELGVLADSQQLIEDLRDLDFDAAESDALAAGQTMRLSYVTELRGLRALLESFSQEASDAPVNRAPVEAVQPPVTVHREPPKDVEESEPPEPTEDSPAEIPYDVLDEMPEHLAGVLRLLAVLPVPNMGMSTPDSVIFNTPVTGGERGQTINALQQKVVNEVISPLMRICGITAVQVDPVEVNPRTMEAKILDPGDTEGRIGWVRSMLLHRGFLPHVD